MSRQTLVWDGDEFFGSYKELPVVRVSMIAKSVGVGSREIVEFLRDHGITSIKTPSSRVDPVLAVYLGRHFSSIPRSEIPVSPIEDRFVTAAAMVLRHCSPQTVVGVIGEYVKLTGGE